MTGKSTNASSTPIVTGCPAPITYLADLFLNLENHLSMIIGETVIEVVFAFPGVQFTEGPALPLSVTDLPMQIATSGPAFAIGSVFTLTITLSESVQPFASVTVTV